MSTSTFGDKINLSKSSEADPSAFLQLLLSHAPVMATLAVIVMALFVIIYII